LGKKLHRNGWVVLRRGVISQENPETSTASEKGQRVQKGLKTCIAQSLAKRLQKEETGVNGSGASIISLGGEDLGDS